MLCYDEIVQKGFTLVLVLIGIVIMVAAGGVYFLDKQNLLKNLLQKPNTQDLVVISQTPQPTPVVSSSPDETASWKTYTNTKYGYSIKYPKDWDVQEFPAIDAYLEVTSFNPNKVINRLSAVIVTISSNPYEKELSVNEGVATVKVGDFTARKETGGALLGSADVHLRVVAPLGMRAIVFESNTGYEKIFTQILSTFKFIP